MHETRSSALSTKFLIFVLIVAPIHSRLQISPTVRSVAQKNVYASEFGSSVMSSFESMSPTLAPEHWGIHGGAPPDNCTGSFSSKYVDRVVEVVEFICQ